MKKSLVLILALVFLCSTSFAQRRYVGWSTGYHTTWGGQNVTNTAWKCYTHLCWFSGGINGPSSSEGKAFSAACHANNTKAIVCLGGAGAGGSFTSATTSGNRANYISTVVAMMQADGFDGIDMDWEDGINTSQYTALHNELRAALDKITPRPLLTVATAQYLAGYTTTVHTVFDQINVMSYWALVGGLNPQMQAFTSKGVPKTKLGVGWGYDTDGEVDVNNPNDIGAKCLYCLDNGYGGVMVWEVARACAKCQDTNAYYVNKNATSIHPSFLARMYNETHPLFSLVNSNGSGDCFIRYSVPTASFVDMKLFNMKGIMVRNLVQGEQQAGNYTLSLGRSNSAIPINSGAYVVKMATPDGSQSGTVIVK
jgi:GH18 family chitinase